MPLATFLVTIIALTLMMQTIVMDSETLRLKKESNFNAAKKNFQAAPTVSSLSKEHLEKENIETALIRTCKHLNVLAEANNCNNANKASYIWGFVGCIGCTNTLDDIFTSNSTLTFSCSKINEYGRGVFKKSIQSSYVVGKGYDYDFTGMDDDNQDPCGYVDIVRK